MTTNEALKEVAKTLKEDKDYRIAFAKVISNSFIHEWNLSEDKDVNSIAICAALNFVNFITKEYSE